MLSPSPTSSPPFPTTLISTPHRPEVSQYPRVATLVEGLEAEWEAVRSEAMAMLDVEGPPGLSFGTMEYLVPEDDQPHGKWHSRPIDCGKDDPATAKTCDAIGRAAGSGGVDGFVVVAQFLRLEPGGHIRPHCGEGSTVIPLSTCSTSLSTFSQPSFHSYPHSQSVLCHLCQNT